jgi:hypothetical protein
MNFRLRVGLATLTIVATGVLYAEGVFKTGWIEAALCIPIGLSLIATGSFARVLQNMLVSIIAISLSLTTLDLILRPVGYRLHYTPTNITPHRFPELPLVSRWDPNQKWDTESYGDLAAMAGNPAFQERRRIIFRTDEFGFRNIPRSGATDLLILGDSFPTGVGTTDSETFAQLLESKYGFRTYNLSYNGTGPYEQFINFAIEWPRLKVSSRPRMIWTFYTGNDMDDTGGETWEISNLPWQHGFSAWLVKCRTYRNRSPLNQWMEGVRKKFWGKPADVIVRSLPDGQPVLFLGGQEAWGKRSRQEVEQHPNFEKLKRTIAAMRTLTAERNVELTILILPTKGEVYRWLLETREPQPDDSDPSGFALAVLEACKNARIVCHNTKSYLVSEAKRLFDTEGKLLWWRDDTHIGKYGHAAIAAYIADSVLNN